MTDIPKGQRFSLTYIMKGDPVSETDTMRFRLGKLMADDKYHHNVRDQFSQKWKKNDSYIRKKIEQELGKPLEIYSDGKIIRGWVNYCHRLTIHMLLDAISFYSNSCPEDKKDYFIL